MTWLAFLAANRWRAVALAMALVAAVQTVRIEGLWPFSGLRQQVRTALAQRDSEAAAHIETKRIYRLAQEEAQRLEGARIIAVAGRQQEITNDIKADYARQLAAARARYDELAGRMHGTAQAGASSARAGGGEPVSRLPGTPGRTDEAANSNGLPRPELTLEERWLATEQRLQLEALIDWVERQQKVPVNALYGPQDQASGTLASP